MGVDKRDSARYGGEGVGEENMKSRNKSFSGIQEMGKEGVKESGKVKS